MGADMLGILAVMGLFAGGFLADMVLNPTADDDPPPDDDLPHGTEGMAPWEQGQASLLDEPDDDADAKGAETPSDAEYPDDLPDSSDRPIVVEPGQRLVGDERSEILQTGSGDDTLLGQDGADQLLGFEGRDDLFGGAGNDNLDGGSGDDQLSGDAGDDWLQAGHGHDLLAGGQGHDHLAGQEGDDTLRGNEGHDSLAGGDGHDSLFGGLGDDELLGDGGDDWLSGGAGQDAVEGGTGQDTLSGLDDDGQDDHATDFLNGGAGDDLLILGAGDYGHGGDGGDTFFITPSTGGAGQDSISYVQDFDPTADRIVITFDPATNPQPELELLRDELTGNVGLVLNGQPIALVQHAADLQLSDIELRPA